MSLSALLLVINMITQKVLVQVPLQHEDIRLQHVSPLFNGTKENDENKPEDHFHSIGTSLLGHFISDGTSDPCAKTFVQPFVVPQPSLPVDY